MGGSGIVFSMAGTRNYAPRAYSEPKEVKLAWNQRSVLEVGMIERKKIERKGEREMERILLVERGVLTQSTLET
jgi:hypothetical protein